MPQVVVVGGGIAGLAAAWNLTERGVQVVLVEASPQVGGKVRCAEVAGLSVDVGAEAMLARRPEGVALAKAVGLGDDLVHPETTESMLWNRGRLVRLPRTFMGIPAEAKAVEEVLSRSAQMRIAVEARLAPTKLVGSDVSLGLLVEERLGREVVDRLLEPLLGGVYAGHAREISTRAAMPTLLSALEREGSLTRAAAELMTSGTTGPVFAGIKGGLGRLATTIANQVSVKTNAEVTGLTRGENSWIIEAGPDRFDADAVIVATPAADAARLVHDIAPIASHELARIDYASMAVITFAFAEHDFPPVIGSGFLVPPVDGRDIKASTFSHRKWGWVAEASTAAGLVVMRCSIGRHGDSSLDRSDEDLVARALADLGSAIGLSAQPVDVQVQRWVKGLPQYAVGHVDRVALIRSEIAQVPGLALCGAAFDGVGIPACIASAAEAVTSIAADLIEVGIITT